MDAAKLLDLPWQLATFVGLQRRVARLRRLVPSLLAQHVRCPVSTPNWIDGFAAEGLPLGELTDGLNHLYGAYNAVDFVVTAGLFELSRHPVWRERVRAELNAVLGERPFPVMDDVPRLPVTWSVIREPCGLRSK